MFSLHLLSDYVSLKLYLKSLYRQLHTASSIQQLYIFFLLQHMANFVLKQIIDK